MSTHHHPTAITSACLMVKRLPMVANGEAVVKAWIRLKGGNAKILFSSEEYDNLAYCAKLLVDICKPLWIKRVTVSTPNRDVASGLDLLPKHVRDYLTQHLEVTP